MAMTFFKAMGEEIGKSFAEDTALDAAREVIQIAKEKGIKLYYAG